MSSRLTSIKNETLPPEIALLFQQLGIVTVEQAVELLDHWADIGIPEMISGKVTEGEFTILKNNLLAQLSPEVTLMSPVPPPGYRPITGVITPEIPLQHKDLQGIVDLTSDDSPQKKDNEEA